MLRVSLRVPSCSQAKWRFVLRFYLASTAVLSFCVSFHGWEGGMYDVQTACLMLRRCGGTGGGRGCLTTVCFHPRPQVLYPRYSLPDNNVSSPLSGFLKLVFVVVLSSAHAPDLTDRETGRDGGIASRVDFGPSRASAGPERQKQSGDTRKCRCYWKWCCGNAGRVEKCGKAPSPRCQQTSCRISTLIIPS
eukprot:1311174-Rhodomonas_salina.1